MHVRSSLHFTQMQLTIAHAVRAQSGRRTHKIRRSECSRSAAICTCNTRNPRCKRCARSAARGARRSASQSSTFVAGPKSRGAEWVNLCCGNSTHTALLAAYGQLMSCTLTARIRTPSELQSLRSHRFAVCCYGTAATSTSMREGLIRRQLRWALRRANQ